MTATPEQIADAFKTSLSRSDVNPEPYRHWFLNACTPEGCLEEIAALPFPAPELGGVSGKRELHNATRTYFDADNQEQFDVVRAFAQAYQHDATISAITSTFDIDLSGSYLRIEYAQDVDGFWLEPHTDLGVKLFTMLLYVSDEPQHSELGTDIYDAEKKHVGRSPFASGAAMVFVPGNDTYHGFEQRPISGVRKSIIINFVTDEWRAREQLAFPDQPIAA